MLFLCSLYDQLCGFLDQLSQGEFRPGGVFLHVHAQFLCHAAAILRVGFVEMHQLTGNGALRHTLHGFGQITEELLLLAGAHQAKQGAGLGAIILTFTQLGKVEAVEVHDLIPSRHKVTHKLFLGVVLGIDLS